MVKLRDTLKGMTNRERIDYLWEYYKIHFFFIIIFFIMSALVINWLFFTESTQVGLYVVSDSSMEEVNDITEALESHETNDYGIVMDHSYHEGEFDDTANPQFYERFTIRLAVGQIDMIVANESFAEHLFDRDAFIPLNEVLHLESINVESRDTYDVNDEVYGLRVNEFDIFDASEGLSNHYLFVPGSGHNKEETAEFIKSIN
ncbi:hypothetical protein SAMN05421734_11240 [Pelagirhabdus alkalitolerans]|uniref:Extracellular solute-binding protein n=1 Tax=Pelagirhabdus alkalitolerans TaxID=1612202 RepID=A0A1G6MSV6_9BACI|nr:hypothetical protein [Pelagirhabdus alkalitolerans]SDC58541.1 hypothetical protein SAMN05421734_11240 [Pelagirhabdus alkalitolerans]